MSFKDQFNKASTIRALSNKSAEEIAAEVESVGYHEEDIVREERFIPRVDFTHPKGFVRYGSAEEYYEQSLKRIYEDYPYDGSLREKIKWENESTYLDLHIFNNRYPRTNGYALFSPAGWGTVSSGSGDTGYGLPADLEYIYLKGGPHTNLHGMSPYSIQFTGSNYYDTDKNRENNLKFDLKDNGISVEFWLRKAAFDASKTQKEVIFDLWNGEASSSAQYGRFRIELTGAANEAGADPFRVTLVSGTTGFVSSSVVASTFTTSSVADDNWHHYAFTFKSASAGIASRFYVDGTLNNECLSGTIGISDLEGTAAGMNEVTGALRAYMGALITPNHRSVNPAAAGAGKLSGSIDEFRYWKTERTAKEIGRHWFTQVGGGTNDDPTPGITTTENINTKLGVYYKFNEGITGVSSTDSVVLDYSGRITNGAWTGYSSDSRNTGSAIVSSSAAIKEFKDPIIYKFHPSVETLAADLQITGSEYDVNNNASIYNSIPAWITEEDSGDKGQKQLKFLTQIMSSYFDTLQLQIESLANLKDITYNTGSNKPLPFAEKLLSSAGLFAPEIFVDADVLEKLADRSENRVFEKSLHDVKNTIYQNIYNNLVYIYKTKGTEKAFRNMIRCFGIDDELVKLNMYAGGIEYEARDNRRNTVSVVDRFVNFNTADNSNAVVYQQQDASDTTDTTGYFPANSKLADGYAQTFEADINFPKKPDANASFYFDTNTISSSLFGVHGVVSEESVPQWDDTADAANYQVFAVRDEIDSTNVRFVLTGTEGGYVPYLVSDLYQDTYEDSHWNLAVRIKPENYPYAGTKPGGEFGVLGGACCGNYTVELHGIQIDAGVVRNEFNLSGLAATESDSLKKTPAGFITGSKRVYIGTHRTNFTGTVLNTTDVKVNACRYWFDYVEDETLLGHAYDTENYGSLKPRAYAYPFDFSGSYGDILKLDTLALNWEFSQNTGSDASGQFTVKDRSSGSATTAAARFGWLGNYLNRQYSGKGYDFLTSSSTVVDKDFVVSSKLQLPENVQSSEMVTILNAQEQNVFTRDSRPINYFFAFEKSMAQAVSTEMINYFATLKDINTLIGAPVNRYRPEYKGLKILRQRFFERVGNSEIDFEKFYEFYKWFDSTLTIMLQQLVPASADFAENVRTVIESHVLERSKYQSKFQNVKKQLNDIEAVAVGSETDTESTIAAATNTPGSGFETPNKNTNRQTGDSDLAGSGQAGWRWSTPGLDENEELDETVNKEYWKYEAETDSPVLSQSAAAVNEDKQIIRANIRVTKHRAKGSVYRFSAGGNSTLGGVGFNQNKKVDFIYNATTPYGETSQGEKSPENMILASGSGAEKLQGTSDDIFPAVSQRLGFDVDPDINKNNDSDNKNDGNLLVPFSLYSSSVESGFNQEVIKNYASGVMITGLHHDLVYDNDIPMQGPFAEKFVGGRSHRHIEFNQPWIRRADAVRDYKQTKYVSFSGSFDASKAPRFVIDNSSAWTAITGATYAGWVRFNDLSQDRTWFRFGDSGYQIAVFLSNGNVALSRSWSGRPIHAEAATPFAGGAPATDTWYHVAIAYSCSALGDVPVVYVNATGTVATAAQTPIGTPAAADQKAAIGGDQHASWTNSGPSSINQTFGTASMAEFTLWKTCLTEDEIKELYHRSAGVVDEIPTYNVGPYDLYSHSRVSELAGWWRMGMGTGSAAHGGCHDSEDNYVDEVSGSTCVIYDMSPVGNFLHGSGSDEFFSGDGARGGIATLTSADKLVMGGGDFTASIPGHAWQPASKGGLSWDTSKRRPEAWQLKFKDVTSSGGGTFKSSFAITPANYDATLARGHDSNIPTAHRLRNVGTKRPVNIQNILMTTASTETRLDGVLAHGSIGNYQKNYQIVQSAARSKNDPFFRDESFKFAIHPETLSIRGRLPLDPPRGRSLQWDGGSPTGNTFIRAFARVTGSLSGWDSVAGGAGSDAKAFSVSAWAYLTSYGDSSTGMLFNIGAIDRYAQMQSNKLRFVIDGSTDGFVESSTLSLNQWYHITLTFAGGDPGGSNTADYMKVYIDGALDSTVTQELNNPDNIYVASTSYSLTIGASYGSAPWNVWGGNIVDFAFWTKELSAAEAAEVYNNGTRFNLRIASPATGSLFSWFKLGDGHSTGDSGHSAGYLFDEAGGTYGYTNYFDATASILRSPPYGAVGPSWQADADQYGSYYGLHYSYPGAQFPGGTLDYALPDRTGANSNKSIIVTRFGAPGGPEVQSRGYMDPAHEEMSVYNALPYRNRSVIDFGGVWRDKLFTMRSFFEGPGDAIWTGGVSRGLASSSIDGTITASINTRDHLNEQRGLNQLSALRCGKYGSDATYGIITEPRHMNQNDNHNYSLVSGFTRVDRGLGYCETPSFHKVNRNSRKIIKSGSAAQTYGGGPKINTLTSSVYDNLYIQHQIPQNMSQYTWVTASMWKGLAQGQIIARGTTLAEGRLGGGTGHPAFRNSPAYSGKRAALFLAPLSYPTCYSASTLEIICTSSLVAASDLTMSWGNKPPGMMFPFTLPVNNQSYFRSPGNMMAGNFGVLQALIKDPVCEWPIDDENPSSYLGAEPSMSMENTLGYPLQGMKWIGDSNEMHNPYDFTPLCWDWLDTSNLKLAAPKNKFQYANRYLNVSGSPTNAEGFLNVFRITDAFNDHNSMDPRNASAHMFNVLMTHRNGPYGYPTFKQVRTGQHPVSRWLRKNNLIGALVPPPVIRGGNGTIQGLRSNKFVNYKEMPIASNALPITFAFEDNDEDPNVANNIILNVSYQNNLDYFTNQGLNNRLNLRERKSADDGNAYNTLADFTLESNLSTVIRFGQKIYPAAENVYQSKVRTRENYDIRTIWNDVRQFRSTQLNVTGAVLSGYNGTTSSMGRIDPSASMWPLDGKYGTRSVPPNALGESYANTGSTMGELLNTYARYGNDDAGTLRPGPSYVMPLRMGSGSHPDDSTDTESYVIITGPEWEAPGQAGVNPYQPYEDYAKTIRLIGKDMSIIPEFRISEHIETYFNIYGGDFLAKFDNVLSLTGASLSGTAPTASNDRGTISPDFYKVYSTTDFMKYFKIVDDDLADQANAADNKIRRHSLELTCDAVLQFLPYKGFYPAERTLELASLLSKSLGRRQHDFGASYVPGEPHNATDAIADRILYEPLMAPGILYNTIKSGIAVSNFVMLQTKPYTDQYSVSGMYALTSSVAILPENSGSALDSCGTKRCFAESAGINGYYSNFFFVGNGNAGDPLRQNIASQLYTNKGFMPMLDLVGSGSSAETGSAEGYYMHRLPFEALRDPEKYLGEKTIPGRWIFDTGMHSSSTYYVNGLAGGSSAAIVAPPYVVYSGVAAKPFYKLAIDNFLCETYNFFQPGPQATTFLSKDDDSFGRVEKGKYYGLRVNLGTADQIGGSTYLAETPNSFCMYSRASAFGVPLVLSGTNSHDTGYGTSSESNRWPTFEHVLPPYYYGRASANIIFKAPYSGKVTVDEILGNCTVEYNKRSFWEGPKYYSYSDPTIEKFDVEERSVVQSQIDTSVDLFEKYLVVPEGTNTQKARWMIRPKFETPIMNFLDKPTTPVNTGSMYSWGGNSAPGYYAGMPIRGMWHQYGRPPTASAGLTLDIVELPTEMSSSKHGDIKVESLANLVGFNTTAKRIGQVASSKRLEEAIVCIPFRTSKGERKFFDVDKDSQEYVTQLALLNKYIFPPSFDFLINEDVSPVAFYAFEFNMNLTQDDLINIWQNLPPDSQSKFQKTTTTIKIRSLVDRLLDNDEHLQWMVFKVKRKAEKDYNVLVKKKLGKGLPIVQPAIDSPYSYNWPYDYFSFVELIKIKEQVVYATEDIITEEDREPPVIPDLREFIPAPADMPERTRPRQDVLDIPHQGRKPGELISEKEILDAARRKRAEDERLARAAKQPTNSEKLADQLDDERASDRRAQREAKRTQKRSGKKASTPKRTPRPRLTEEQRKEMIRRKRRADKRTKKKK